MNQEAKKRCSTCGVLKPLTEFHKQRSVKDGRKASCKKCTAKYSKQWYKEHRTEHLAYQKQWYKEHRAELVTYREEHRTERVAYSKQYNKEHRTEQLTHNKQWYKEHRTEHLAYQKQWYKEHRVEKIAQQKQYRETKRGRFIHLRIIHRRRARIAVSVSDLTPEQWMRILKNQKQRCNMCHKKFTAKRPATMDHITPLSKGGDLTSPNVQALCRSCNSSKNAKILKCFINSWCL